MAELDLTPAEAELIAAIRKQGEGAKIDPDRIPRIWQYVRWSHIDSDESGLSKDVQLRQMGVKVATLVAGWRGPVHIVEPLIDDHVRASKVDMRNRKAGRIIWEKAQPGDAVVISRIDRGFRNVNDLTHSLKHWTSRNIAVYFVADGSSYSDANDKLKVHILAAIAQYQSDMLSVRSREVAEELRLRGRPNGQPRLWEHFVGPKGHKVRVTEEAIWQDVVTMFVARARHKWPWESIADFIEALIARRESRKIIPRDMATARRYSQYRIRRAVGHLLRALPDEPEMEKHLRDLVKSKVPLDQVHLHCPPPLGRGKGTLAAQEAGTNATAGPSV